MTEREIDKVFETHKMMCGRMISGSKSGYRKLYPKNLVVFNANIITKTHGKIWHGDLDITLDEITLKQIAKEVGELLYVLREMDCRFDTEKDSVDVLIKKAVWNTEL